jgi:polygalacturonase
MDFFLRFKGNGKKWWGAIDFLKHQENRPRLLHIKGSQSVLVENLLFKDSPYWTFYAESCDGLVIRFCEVDARWTNQNYHTVCQITRAYTYKQQIHILTYINTYIHTH